MIFFFLLVPDCPAGYVQVLSRPQLLNEGLEKTPVLPDIDSCADECLNDPTCCIFEFWYEVNGMGSWTCKRHKECDVKPSRSNPNPQFCKKSKHIGYTIS